MQQRIRELAFFLNLFKEELRFEDADDFNNKIRLDFNFRFKIQKFVFLAKYFGWNNSYVFNLHHNGLTEKQNQIQTKFLNDFKSALNNKIINDIKLFEDFEINYNRVFVLGSLDYLRIVLREENLNIYLKKELFDLISKYIDDVDNIYCLCDRNGELFENMNLSSLEDFFDRIQDYISQEMDIIPRLDDDDFDESLFY